MKKTTNPLNTFNYFVNLKWDYTIPLQALANQVAYSLLNRLDWLGDKQRLVAQWRRDVRSGQSDLANEARLAILEQVHAQQEREPDRWVDLERPFVIHELKSRVLIRDSTAAWVDRETTPIQEVYRPCRRWIESQRQHVSIDEINANWVEDETDGMSLERRVGRACDLYGRAVNLADSFGIFAQNKEDWRDTEELISSLALTKKQGEILAYLLQGYRAQAIATARGLNIDTVRDSIALIQQKALAVFSDFEQKPEPRKSISLEQKALIAQMIREGKSYREIRQRTSCSSYLITKIKRELGL